MSEYLEISDNVSELIDRYISMYFDPNLIYDYLAIIEEIILAGLNEVITRREMEREVKE